MKLRRPLRNGSPANDVSDVRLLQQELRLLSYEIAAQEDGFFGPTTLAAVRDFKRKHNLRPAELPRNEVVDLITAEKINEEVDALSNGNTDPTQEQLVKIIAWPEQAAKLEHRFDVEKPCPVSISFDQTPATVVINSNPEQPVYVDMAMNVVARQDIPVCIKLCEPICAKSAYTIGLDVFDEVVAAITVQGETKLSSCQTCVDFTELEPGRVFAQAFPYKQLVFTPLGEPLRTAVFGDPQGQVKLAFPNTGLRITFPQAVHDIILTVNQYANPALEFSMFNGSTLLGQFTQNINNQVKEVSIPQSNVTAIEIKGGGNEASVVTVCFSIA